MNQLIDIVHEEIDRLSTMADIAGIEFNIFCSKAKLDAKTLQVKPFVETIVWKTIDGYPNYMVSNKGEVMNTKTRRILKPSNDKDGYYKLDLCKNNIKKTHKVHALVAYAFIDSPNGCACVDHIDHSRINNDVSNLRWCSTSQNARNKSKQSSATSSIYKGVSFLQDREKWKASIWLDDKSKHIGYFASEVQAAVAYNNYAIIHFKEFACLNVISPENVIDIR